MQQDCMCIRPGLALRVVSLAGEPLELEVRSDWTVVQLKAKMQQIHNLKADELCLTSGRAILPDAAVVQDLHFNEHSPPINWVYRDPELTRWLKLVQDDWQAIHRAPETARKSPEVMLAVMHQSRQAVAITHTELLHDASFLRQVCEMRGFDATVRPWRLGCLL